jgi:hypothetical protein
MTIMARFSTLALAQADLAGKRARAPATPGTLAFLSQAR